jgi:uracil-DNA glycosylase
LPYLQHELAMLSRARVYLCLGRIAFEQFQEAAGRRVGEFAHGASATLRRRYVLCSYHVSRQNTQTGRLTVAMFDEIIRRTLQLAGLEVPS